MVPIRETRLRATQGKISLTWTCLMPWRTKMTTAYRSSLTALVTWPSKYRANTIPRTSAKMSLTKGTNKLHHKRQAEVRKEAPSNYKYRLEEGLMRPNLNQSISQLRILLLEIQGKSIWNHQMLIVQVRQRWAHHRIKIQLELTFNKIIDKMMESHTWTWPELDRTTVVQILIETRALLDPVAVVTCLVQVEEVTHRNISR